MIFFWIFLNFAQFSYLPMFTRLFGIFYYFFLDLESFAQNKKDLVCSHSQKPSISISRDLNKIKKNKKNPKHVFVDIAKYDAKFQQKILNSMVVGARQSFQFFRQVIWFLENNRTLSKFKYWILHSGPGKYNTW